MAERRRLLCVIMDGVGEKDSDYGNAVKAALTPNLGFLRQSGIFCTLNAHGTYVGLPSDSDIGNSEVGHNALGAGRIYSQGASLVQNAIESGSLFRGTAWLEAIKIAKSSGGAMHFIGLLSDGNVHSHQEHLFAMLREAQRAGVPARIHVLFDGRDVGEKSAEIYVNSLERTIGELEATFADCDIKIASGGGRMTTTMDRYEADWSMVERGWQAHVHGKADHKFGSLSEAVASFRQIDGLTDQYFPSFILLEDGKPVAPIKDGDAVIFFNFRGDRAIEITRAFTDEDFTSFDRGARPKVFYAGMMQYDGDLHLPERFLVEPPAISDTLGEHMVHAGLKQFACSETQKFGHVTYFWNGNRSGYFSKELEEYLEIPSDVIPFEQKPWMKAAEIAAATCSRLESGSFDFGRINFANGDMVGHTGDFEASVVAVATVDLMLGKLIKACRKSNTILVVTADHGNCDEMFEGKPIADWLSLPFNKRAAPKTSHTLSQVPFYFWDPAQQGDWVLEGLTAPSIGNIANTVLLAMGQKPQSKYLESLVKRL